MGPYVIGHQLCGNSELIGLSFRSDTWQVQDSVLLLTLGLKLKVWTVAWHLFVHLSTRVSPLFCKTQRWWAWQKIYFSLCTLSGAQTHPLCRLLAIYWSVSHTRPHISGSKCSRQMPHDTSKLLIPCSLSSLTDIVIMFSGVSQTMPDKGRQSLNNGTTLLISFTGLLPILLTDNSMWKAMVQVT